VIIFEFDGRTVRFDDSDLERREPDGIYGSLLKGHFYEETFLRYIQSLDLSGTYLDIGAYIGTHTVFFAMMCPTTRVHSFEPQPTFFSRLVANVEMNGLSERVVTHRFALSERSSDHIRLSFEGETSDVAIRRLDDVVSEPVDLVKMDVEGMEPLVLAGARRLLRRDRPVVFAEARTNNEYVATATQLRTLGYRRTGRVFNATPTYEFVAVPWQRRALDSPTGRHVRARIPIGLRRKLRRFVPPSPEHVADR
jgi:FkbM family methyltransferase